MSHELDTDRKDMSQTDRKDMSQTQTEHRT